VGVTIAAESDRLSVNRQAEAKLLKSELIQRIIGLNPTLPESVCRTLVEKFFDAITDRLVNGGDIELRGFGRFFLSQYAERTVRNPRTGGPS
jgi:integration host factor subunit beta